MYAYQQLSTFDLFPGKFKTNVTLEKMAECESSNGGKKMHKSAR